MNMESPKMCSMKKTALQSYVGQKVPDAWTILL